MTMEAGGAMMHPQAKGLQRSRDKDVPQGVWMGAQPCGRDTLALDFWPHFSERMNFHCLKAPDGGALPRLPQEPGLALNGCTPGRQGRGRGCRESPPDSAETPAQGHLESLAESSHEVGSGSEQMELLFLL